MEGNLAILEGNFDWFPGKSKFFPAVLNRDYSVLTFGTERKTCHCIIF